MDRKVVCKGCHSDPYDCRSCALPGSKFESRVTETAGTLTFNLIKVSHNSSLKMGSSLIADLVVEACIGAIIAGEDSKKPSTAS